MDSFHPELWILVLVCSAPLVRPNATSQAEINSHLLKTWPSLDWAPVTVYFGSVTIVVFPFGFNSEPLWSKLILCSSYKPSGWKWKGTGLKAVDVLWSKSLPALSNGYEWWDSWKAEQIPVFFPSSLTKRQKTTVASPRPVYKRELLPFVPAEIYRH